MSEDSTVRRIVPQSGLDWNMMLTDTMWGSPQISQQLMEKVKQRKNKEQDFDKQAAFDLLSFYSRDIRLANLSVMFGEVNYCQYYLDLAGDLLRENMPESFATSLSRSASVLELSQSKGGFLRRRQNTLTQENISGDMKQEKKRLVFAGANKR